MKVLVVHNRYRSSSPSGEDRVVDQEHAALEAAGHQVRRFERRSDDIASMPLVKKASVPATAVWNPALARDLQASFDAWRPDVVHVHNVFPLLSPSVFRACARAGIPSVVTLHNFVLVCAAGNLFRDGSICRACTGRRVPLPAVAHGCFRQTLSAAPRAMSVFAHRRLWQNAPSAYVFLSGAQRRELEPVGLPVHRSFVKPNLVPDVPRRRPRPGSAPHDDGLIVYLGRLTEEKGLRVLMESWQTYLRATTCPRLRLVIAGAGPMEAEINQWANARASVDFVGFLDRGACADLVAAATAVVAPSEWPEPFGLVVAEAMAAGVPPIATDHGAFRELVTHGHDGLLYPPGDPSALSKVLARLDREPGWAVQLGVTAYDTYRRRFAPAGNVAELERIYRFAIANPR